MDHAIKQTLSQAFQPVSDHYATVIAHPATKISLYETDFLTHFQIYRVQYRQPRKAVVFYVGFGSGSPPYFLTENPQNFVAMAQAERLAISSAEMARAYAKTYLEITRSMRQRFYLIDTIEDIQFRSLLNEAQLQSKQAFLARYQPLIQGTTVESEGQDFVVSVFAIREQNLEQHRVTVTQPGDVADDITLVETELPLIYGG